MTDTIPIENGQQVGILVTSSVSILMVIVAVGLRLTAKRIANRIDYSDYCILAALVGQDWEAKQSYANKSARYATLHSTLVVFR